MFSVKEKKKRNSFLFSSFLFTATEVVTTGLPGKSLIQESDEHVSVRCQAHTHIHLLVSLFMSYNVTICYHHYYKKLYFSKPEIIQMSTTWKWKKKSWFIQTRGYFSAANRNELQIHVMTWIHLKNAILSEKSQTQKGTYLIIPFIWSFRNDRTNLMVIELRILDVRSGGGEHKELLEMWQVGTLWGVRNVLSLNRKTG